MNKIATFVGVSFFATLALSPPSSIAEPTGNRFLDRKISSRVEYGSFDEAIRQVESNTEFTVSIPTNVVEFLRSLPRVGLTWRVGSSEEISMSKYLDTVFGTLGLQWTMDEKQEVIEAQLAWVLSDSRTPTELLQSVHKPQYSGMYAVGEKPIDREWETAFHALLSKEGNFGKAWMVRQRAFFDRLFRSVPEQLHLVLVDSIIAEAKEKYILVVLEQPIEMYPGRGSISCYWFRENGVLEGAEILSTGHRCELVDASIADCLGSGTRCEFQLVVKFNSQSFLTQCYRLRSDGLQLLSVVTANGKVVNPADSGFGLVIRD